jgi:hypothetical protein
MARVVLGYKEGMAMFILIGAAVAANIVLTSASAVPAFNVEPSCSAAARRAAKPNYVAICRRTEQSAHRKLVQEWPRFSAAAKTRCVSVSMAGGQPTYTELLTCLEMNLATVNLHGNEGSASIPSAMTTGQGTK